MRPNRRTQPATLPPFKMFNALKKLFSASKPASAGRRHRIETCTDCGTEPGKLHDLFCLKERCPFCGGQLATCDCIIDVLKLSDAEQQAVAEYIDDSVPPLSDIMQRWSAALARKGRIPFEAYPDDPIRAAYRGDLEAMRAFLDDGFAANHGNEVGYTALMGAARGANVEVIQLLLSRGAQAGLADKRGYTAVHWAVAQPAGDDPRRLACLRALLKAGAAPDARNEEGITPLMNAAWFGCDDSVRELLRCGADPLSKDNKGRTARSMAIERGHHRAAELLE